MFLRISNQQRRMNVNNLITIAPYIRQEKKRCNSIPALITEASDTLFRTMKVIRVTSL